LRKTRGKKYPSLNGVSKNFKRFMDLQKYILEAEDHLENEKKNKH